MLQITPQMRIRVAVEPVDGRKGIDSLAHLCREKLKDDPHSGGIFIFRNRRGTMLRILTFDGQGFWLATKRLSKGRFQHWPKAKDDSASVALLAHQVQLLLAAGDPSVDAAPIWRPVTPASSTQTSRPNKLKGRPKGRLPG